MYTTVSIWKNVNIAALNTKIITYFQVVVTKYTVILKEKNSNIFFLPWFVLLWTKSTDRSLTLKALSLSRGMSLKR